MKQFYPSMSDVKNQLTIRKIVLMFLVFFISGSLTLITGQTVTTDKYDYLPGDVVTISGTGWQPGEQITIVIDHLIFDHPNETLYTTANSSGELFTDYYVIDTWDLGESFLLTATGTYSGTATTTFTDGGGSYTIKIYAADPAVGKAPYLPTYTKMPPALLPCDAVNGRADDPLTDAVLMSPAGTRDAVTSLAPEDMALCQVVPFYF